MSETFLEELDFDLAMSNIGQEMAPAPANAVVAQVLGPPDEVWEQVLHYARRALPLQRACALCGLAPSRVKAWLRANPHAQQQLQEAQATASQQLLHVVWDEAVGRPPEGDRPGRPGNWKAALGLLSRVDPAFNPQYRKQSKAGPSTNVQINTQTANMIAAASVEDLRKVLGQ